MMPANDPMSAVRSKIEVDNAQARVRFAKDVPCFTSAELAGHSARNESATVSRWKAAKKAFSVELSGRDLFPAFQFRDGKPDPAVAQVLAALPPGIVSNQLRQPHGRYNNVVMRSLALRVADLFSHRSDLQAV